MRGRHAAVDVLVSGLGLAATYSSISSLRLTFITFGDVLLISGLSSVLAAVSALAFAKLSWHHLLERPKYCLLALPIYLVGFLASKYLGPEFFLIPAIAATLPTSALIASAAIGKYEVGQRYQAGKAILSEACLSRRQSRPRYPPTGRYTRQCILLRQQVRRRPP